ncbi:hypothetical protein JOF53_005682 [Crossiella equi]|uniref:DUF3558 domain-containing protein n=1 Tax=Crossiella equi TaxID=130796 RepID=A0ABS5AJR4_9PSEU|nr:hypothetical protein [Crossiella equi]MBP2476810.1 hypothetical protein [Crossiella equi]
MFRVKPLLAASTALCLLTGLTACGGEDLAKKNFPRQTVPAVAAGGNAAEGGAGAVTGKPVDPAFAPDKLRRLDPCSLLDPNALPELGDGGAPVQAGYDNCTMTYRKDDKRSTVEVELGRNMLLEIPRLDRQIAGVKALQAVNGQFCDHKLLLQDGDYSLGLEVTVRAEAANRCDLGAKAAEGVIGKIKAGGPLRGADSGVLAALDPCNSVDPSVLAGLLTNVPGAFPFGLHQCSWRRGDGLSVKFTFSLGRQPKRETGAFKPTEVKVDDSLTVYTKFSNTSFAKCEVSWVYRVPGTNPDGNGEIVEVDIQNVPNVAGLDTCQKGTDIIKAMKAAFPKQ